MKYRIKQNELIEGEDYIIVSLPKNNKQTGRGGKNRIDYLLTFNCARMLAAREKGQKSRNITNYLIACEDKLRAIIATQQAVQRDLTRDELFDIAFKQRNLLIARQEESHSNHSGFKAL